MQNMLTMQTNSAMHSHSCLLKKGIAFNLNSRGGGGGARVVPKSHRPKGQPRSTRNEFPIRANFGNSRKYPIWRLKRGEN